MPAVEAGEVATVRFRFACILLPGATLANSGVAGLIDRKRYSLRRLVDAVMLRVQPEMDFLIDGLVDF